MIYNVGDWLLAKHAVFGYSSSSINMGPYIVKLVEIISSEEVRCEHIFSFKDIANKSTSTGITNISDIISKLDSRDIKTLFKEGIL